MSKILEEFTYDDALSVCYPLDKEFYCYKHDITVIADGYLPDGTRVHIIKEDFFPEAVMLRKAIVISKQTSSVGVDDE